MPPRRWHMGRQTQMSEPIRHYLETGEWGSPDRATDRLLVFQLAGAVLRGHYSEIAALWARHGASLLQDWVAEHPGCRPFSWWVVVASEPRRVLRGVELLAPRPTREDRWRSRFGGPFFVQAKPADFIGFPTIESEVRYLDRLGLLAGAERARVEPGDWEPVEIKPFLVERPALASTNGAPKKPAA
jgi:hypothetical protein